MADLVNSLDLNLLKVFRALYETESTTHAAEILGISQSAVSRALAKLRVSFKDLLFEWRRSRMMPTSTAHTLLADIQAALAGAERTLSHMHRFELQATTNSFALGLTDHATFAFFGELFAEIRREAPNVKINLLTLGANEATVPHRLEPFAMRVFGLAHWELLSLQRNVCFIS